MDAIDRLPERHRFVMEMIYVQDMEQQDIAALLNVHYSRVSQIHKKAIELLRRKLHEH